MSHATPGEARFFANIASIGPFGQSYHSAHVNVRRRRRTRGRARRAAGHLPPVGRRRIVRVRPKSSAGSSVARLRFVASLIAMPAFLELKGAAAELYLSSPLISMYL